MTPINEPNFKLIGERIRDKRRGQSLSQSTLAELTNLSDSYISHVENGKKQVSLSALLKISAALLVPLQEFLTGNQPTRVEEEYAADMMELLSDCTPFEKRVLYENTVNLKRSLRNNVYMLRSSE